MGGPLGGGPAPVGGPVGPADVEGVDVGGPEGGPDGGG